jgi:hypothetical protein
MGVAVVLGSPPRLHEGHLVHLRLRGDFMQAPRKRQRTSTAAEKKAAAASSKSHDKFHDASDVFKGRGTNFDAYRPDALKLILQHLPRPDKPTWAAIEAGFRELHEAQGPKAMDKWLKSVYAQALETGSPMPTYGGGRPHKLTEQQVRKCLVLFKAGVKGDSKESWYGYTSIQHAANVCLGIRRVLDQAEVTVDTLWRRMKEQQRKEFGKKFNKISIWQKPTLTDVHKQQRLDTATRWATWDLDFLKRIVWIDEKTEHLFQCNYRCYAPDDMQSYAVAAPYKLRDNSKIRYLAGVSAYIGPAYIDLISGTTGFDSAFTVRTCIPAAGHHHPAVICR